MHYHGLEPKLRCWNAAEDDDDHSCPQSSGSGLEPPWLGAKQSDNLFIKNFKHVKQNEWAPKWNNNPNQPNQVTCSFARRLRSRSGIGVSARQENAGAGGLPLDIGPIRQNGSGIAMRVLLSLKRGPCILRLRQMPTTPNNVSSSVLDLLLLSWPVMLHWFSPGRRALWL